MPTKQHRPPVVVVLGHVDHGKTTLLDYIRKSNLASKEAGEITQSIGAYEAKIPLKGYDADRLTFIDTPGHEAFTKLRSRGAQVADIAILIVDATASVMPQTIESISHIKQAKIPFIVAINKVDLERANVEKVNKDLSKHDVLTENMGGTIPVIPISAKSGTGVNDLLEAILLVASEQDLSYDLEGELEVYVIETQHEKAGIAVSCIIKNGALKVGDTIYAQELEARVRALITDRGSSVKEVTPSMPFMLLGFKELPEVGVQISRQKKSFEVAKNELEKHTESDSIFKEDEGKKLMIIVKADSKGSIEALLPPLLENENIEVVLYGIGEISKSDIFLAKVSKAIIIGFNAKIPQSTEKIAMEEKVVIKTYKIIYKLLEELAEVSLLLKEREEKSKNLKGEAKLQAVFTIEGSKIAGVKITKGKFELNDKLELYRDNQMKGEAMLSSIKQRSKHVKGAKKDQEAGLLLEPQLDIQAGDVIKSYSI
ncbi:hypothetical protein A3H80_02990 [Candidatus Roizmanbacteria bacterium RIFCSPLOWO2_02_FULL_37_19]|uniref:Tr-type G domain-containing protein n=1 Tax=Candidatus Roizmanbacteria bacterium RIFCSPHIGHO2_02_FULL_37_24 TaxID=1802037 RepID=A0A1F7GYK1_9BACT|nr:MAG: hypothetical protein A2862_00195 [Candidatus Roizmanbacteria bacterium RIFCSPHIGHO2_01_FULL_38_41]OGK24011.1 MAG: hypothetical protein A3C24_02890 [Candidatus Roizmanbacteria bacterium RIFCSPHIGHO2_02_FULL_37_24]OGK32375.1 MAG: hypothetical protein A3E10_04300 [Candidatus Roizmanbacteria bacterium RIFCSPHIGHO2_12_FULL_37_23]OGK44265.1 MAG: hypothetical protein A2956_00255 [Candidatus Roizmanbacteria bacterium RIFCSPLOWO2_01_FULL_37_57]OGK53735.1 MAG: hypothetical protein A3H80_02990 [Ca